MSDDAVKNILDKMDLSRTLRYTYGSFLLLFLAIVINPSLVQTFKGIPATMLVLGSLIIGSGIYVLHRSIIIPIHHWLGCILFDGYDAWAKKKDAKHESSNPVTIIEDWEVPFPLKIISYSILRKSGLFKDMERDLNLEHAENGLLVMTSEGMLFAVIYSILVACPKVEWPIFALLAILFWACSYPPAFVLHSLEGRYIRVPERSKTGRDYLRKAGIPVKEEPVTETTMQTK